MDNDPAKRADGISDSLCSLAFRMDEISESMADHSAAADWQMHAKEMQGAANLVREWAQTILTQAARLDS